MSNEEEWDPFKPSSGLPDNLDIEIKEAWFTFDPEYMDGQQLLLKMNVMTNDETFGEAGYGTLQYSTGKGWLAEDRGAIAVRDDGNNRKGFQEQCAYNLFILAALECPGAENVLRSENRGDPRKAAMWVGTSWHIERKEKDYGGDIGKISRLLPTRFLGEKGINSVEAQAVKASPAGVKKAAGATKAAGPVSKAPAGPAPAKAAGPVKKAPPAAQAPTPTPEANGDGGGTWDATHPLYETLWAVAYEAADHESFVETAFSTIAGVAGDPVVEQGVMDNGPESMWAAVVAAYEAANQ